MSDFCPRIQAVWLFRGRSVSLHSWSCRGPHGTAGEEKRQRHFEIAVEDDGNLEMALAFFLAGRAVGATTGPRVEAHAPAAKEPHGLDAGAEIRHDSHYAGCPAEFRIAATS